MPPPSPPRPADPPISAPPERTRRSRPAPGSGSSPSITRDPRHRARHRLVRDPCRELHGRRRSAACPARRHPRALSPVPPRRRPVDRRLGRSTVTTSPPARRSSIATSRRSFPSISPGRAMTSVFLNDLLPLPYTRRRLRASATMSTRSRRRWAGRCSSRTPRPMSSSRRARSPRSTSSRDRPAHRLRPSARRQQRLRLRRQPRHRPRAYLDAFPVEHVGEIHLAGHADGEDDDGDAAPDRRP